MSTQTPDAAAAGLVTLTCRDGNGALCTKRAELLVVACDPRNLYDICDYTSREYYVFDQITNFTFHTSLLKVSRSPLLNLVNGVIFAPGPLDRMDGSIYAFRNESAKTFGLQNASVMNENWVTVYQLQKEPGRRRISRELS
jgi:hypothetical protein